MAKQARDVQCKIKVLRHAEQSGCVAKTCRYFGIGRASFYRWRTAYRQLGEVGLVNARPIPNNPANPTPPEIVDKVLHLRSTYHLGPIRNRLASRALPRHQNLRGRRKSNPQAQRRQPIAARNTRPEDPHQALQQAGPRPSHPDGCQTPHLRWPARQEDPSLPVGRHRRCNSHPGTQDLREAYPSQCNRLRPSHHREIPVPNPRKSNRQRPT